MFIVKNALEITQSIKRILDTQMSEHKMFFYASDMKVGAGILFRLFQMCKNPRFWGSKVQNNLNFCRNRRRCATPIMILRGE